MKVQVVAAVVERGDKLLLCQRPPRKRYGGLWEFPGGKVHAGESMLDAAHRELFEELGVTVVGGGELLFEMDDPGSQYVIRFIRVAIDGEPVALEHSNLAWLSISELTGMGSSLAPTDRAFVGHVTSGGKGRGPNHPDEGGDG